MNIIVVTSLNCIEPGVWQSLHWKDVINRDIMRQTFIDTKQQIEIKHPFDVEMKKELTRMHLSISTSTPDNQNLLFQYPAQRMLNNLLNTHNSGQLLPSPVRGSVIGDMNKVAHRNLLN